MIRKCSSRHEILEMLGRGAITVDEAVWQLERGDERLMALSGLGFDAGPCGRKRTI